MLIDLLIPGLLTPLRGGERAHPFAGVANEPLWQKFSRASREAAGPAWSAWAQTCRCARFPFAAWLARSAGLPDTPVLLAEPVRVRAEHRGIYLLGLPEPALRDEEVMAVHDSLRPWLKEDGCALQAVSSTRWLLQLPQASPSSQLPQLSQFSQQPALETRRLAEAIGFDLAHVLPRGADALRWQARQMEWQMLLQTHAVNHVRQQRGESGVQSIWLSGEGDINAAQWPDYQLVITDEPAIQAFAAHHGAKVLHPDAVQDHVFERMTRVLVFISALELPFAHGQRQRWQEMHQQLQPLWQNMETLARRATLNLVPDDGHVYRLTPANRWQFWRRTNLLETAQGTTT